jgi:hypothetical protein
LEITFDICIIIQRKGEMVDFRWHEVFGMMLSDIICSCFLEKKIDYSEGYLPSMLVL